MTVSANALTRYKNISIHALLTEGDRFTRWRQLQQWSISIHALLTEGDAGATVIGYVIGISIHALLTEGDLLRRAGLHHSGHFNPRPPHGG